MSESVKLPPQQLPFSKKNKTWRKQHLDWADSKSVFNNNLVRKTIQHKKINYDLMNGILHMEDIHSILDPENLHLSSNFDKIRHYPIMNSKINVLRGEELKRVFDYRVIVSNPNAITKMEDNKRDELLERLTALITNTSLSEEEYNKELEEINQYYSYEWQDLREIRSNALLKHYVTEYNIPLIFNQGFMDATIVGEEIYKCDIVGGEPTIERINPNKIRVFKSGYSNKIEDADIIVLEDYWSPGRIIDTYYESLSKKDRDYIENLPDSFSSGSMDSMGNVDSRDGFIRKPIFGDTGIVEEDLFGNYEHDDSLPYDLEGNIRVIRMYWKSRRRIKKVKSYDPETGEEQYNFYPENYTIDKNKGEEEFIYYINEAWEGTKIGDSIYVNMRPCVVQYNRLSNPSLCHFGIIGSIYNLNDDKPYSLVDMMKQYNYMYDAIHDRLNKNIASSWGTLINIDLAKVPKGWDITKWMHYARVNKIAVIDSFKEGNYGAATGKIAGALNNASSGVMDAGLGNAIQQDINLLEFIKMEMSEIVGISKQREGQISNRETVGGVERATVQSAHITEWLFSIHDDVRKRTLECFLETAKIALQGRSKKFQHILPNSTTEIINIEGDEFAEADYGLLVDNSRGTQELAQKMEMLAQAALQNQTLNFSTIMQLYSTNSIAEKQKIVEKNERDIQRRNQEAQQQQNQIAQQQSQQLLQTKQMELEHESKLNAEDNETKIIIATINAENKKNDGIEDLEATEENKRELLEKMRQFDEKIKLEKEKLEFEKDKSEKELQIKRNKK